PSPGPPTPSPSTRRTSAGTTRSAGTTSPPTAEPTPPGGPASDRRPPQPRHHLQPDQGDPEDDGARSPFPFVPPSEDAAMRGVRRRRAGARSGSGASRHRP